MGKVLFIINSGVYPKIVGGMEIFNYHLIRQLSEDKDIQVSYMATAKYNYDSATYIRTPSIKPMSIFLPVYLFVYLLFHREYKKVVFSFSSASWILWYLYACIVNILRLESIIVIHHGKDVAKDHVSGYKKFFKSARYVIAVSDDIKNNYDAAYDIECTVVYPLIPFTLPDNDKEFYRKQYNVPLHSNVIAMVGSLKRMKNPIRLLEALALFEEEELVYYNPLIIYAGDGPQIENLKKFISDKNLTKYVRFLGVIPNETIREVMTIADIYVIASDFEGTSISLLEAMFNSKAIIASDVPGLNYMITHDFNGLLYDVESSSVLKNYMVKLMEDKKYATNLGMHARTCYEKKYSYDAMLNYYKEILK